MKRYGLVFRINDQCYLAEYVEGVVQGAFPIRDSQNVYQEMNPREMSLVEIVSDGESEEGENISILDLKMLTITSEKGGNPEGWIPQIIEDRLFTDLANSIFENEVVNLS